MKKLDASSLHEQLDIPRPAHFNEKAKVDLESVFLPDGYKDIALELISRSFHECDTDYIKPEFMAVALSGGIDSSTALTAAVQAVGRDKTRAVLLRHKYMTETELEDSRYADKMIEFLDVKTDTIDISGLVKAHWDLTDRYDYGEYIKHLLRAEGIARARASTMQSYVSLEAALTMDTTNMTELAFGNLSVGAYIGMVEIFEDLLKCEVYELARQLRIPKFILDQPKRISETDSSETATASLIFLLCSRYKIKALAVWTSPSKIKTSSIIS